MEEEKAAAYYDELTRKGGGAARFKQGLGFSSSTSSSIDPAVPSRGSALPSSGSSFLRTFVKASSPSKTSELEKQAQIQSIQNKLKKKTDEESSLRDKRSNRRSRSRSRSRERDRDRDRRSRRRSRSKSRERERSPRRRSRSRSRDRDRDRRSKRRSRSRDRERERERERRRNRRSSSPRERRREKTESSKVDYAKLIKNYDELTPAERVKAKMKLQLSETAEKDETKGMGAGWERFEFNKDAPLDDEEIEAAEDDGAIVKHIGQSFRLSAVEARREERIKAAHDEAMFGVSSLPPPPETDDDDTEEETRNGETTAVSPVASLISDQVLAIQKGSWRDRARKV